MKIIRDFISSKWKSFKNKVSNRLNSIATPIAAKIDASFSANYPIPARFFNFFGITAEKVVGESGAVLGFVVEQGENLCGGLSDAVDGFWRVTSTVLPIQSSTSLWPATPRIIRAIWSEELREDFFRAAKRDIVFAVGSSALLQWQLKILNKMLNFIGNNSQQMEYNSQNNERLDNSYNIYFYIKAGAVVTFSCVVFHRYILPKGMNYFYEATLDGMVVSENAPKRADNKVLAELKEKDVVKNEDDSLSILNIRLLKEIAKKFIGLQIYTIAVPIVKDTCMGGVIWFNDKAIGSELIAYSAWAIKARILAKDLGTSRLLSAQMPDCYIKPIQGHRNWRYFGEGLAYQLANVGFFKLFYSILEPVGFSNIPVLSFFTNLAIFNLFYKLAIISSNIQDFQLKEADWNEEGLNLSEIYKPVFFDPIMNRIIRRYERKLGIDAPASQDASTDNTDLLSEPIDLGETKEFFEALGVSSEQYFCEMSTGEVSTSSFLERFNAHVALKLQNILYNLNQIRNEGTDCIQTITAGGVNSATGITKSINSNIPGGTRTLELGAAVSTVVLGTPAAAVGAAVYLARIVAQHGEVLTTGATVASNVIKNWQSVPPASKDTNSGTAVSSVIVPSSTITKTASPTSPKAVTVSADSKSAAEVAIPVGVPASATIETSAGKSIVGEKLASLSTTRSDGNTVLQPDKKQASDTQAKVTNEEMSPQEKEFWKNLRTKKLSKAERASLRIFAPSLIVFLNTFLILRKNGSAIYLNFLSNIFSPNFKGIVQRYLKVCTDYRIEELVTFLYIHQKNYLEKLKVEVKDDKTYVGVESDSLLKGSGKTKNEAEIEDDDVEKMDITPEEIKNLRLATAITLFSKPNKAAVPIPNVTNDAKSAAEAGNLAGNVNGDIKSDAGKIAATNQAVIVTPATATVQVADSASPVVIFSAAGANTVAAAPMPASQPPASPGGFLTQFTDYTSTIPDTVSSTVSYWYRSVTTLWPSSATIAANSPPPVDKLKQS